MRTAGAILISLSLGGPVAAQFPDVLSEQECTGCAAGLAGGLVGTWSSVLTSSNEADWPPEDYLCFVACTADARARAASLLADPKERRPTHELLAEVVAVNHGRAMSLMTAAASRHAIAASEAFRSPSFACDPNGFAAQVVSALPLVIERRNSRLLLRYEEFGVVRSFDLSPGGTHAARADGFGRSTARLEQGVLVVETVGAPAGRLHDWFGGAPHSGALRALERYTTSRDGRWLLLELTFEDLATLREPLVLHKRWRRTPSVRLARHQCDVMGGQLQGAFADYVDPRVLEVRR